MPNDAKLGLVLGMGLVVLISLVFFRKDGANAQPVNQKGPGQVAPKTAPSVPDVPKLPPLPDEPPPAPDVGPADPFLEPPPLPGAAQ